MINLLEKFIGLLPSAGRVLDLGAGQGVEANRLASVGFQVDAVDRTAPATSDLRVTWHIQTVESFIDGLDDAATYDGILLKNIIQMLDKEWVLGTGLPKAVSVLKPGGVLAIETFWKEPEPPYRKSMRLYTVDEIRKAIPEGSVLFSEQVTEEKNDLEGALRTFGLTRLLLKKDQLRTT